jgi:hypothetical protein
MPAIQPARLKQQAALLGQHFDNPAAFVRNLHNLLDFYADRARRPGQTGTPAPLIQAYQVRPPVLREILLTLSPLANEEPQQALALCDALWGEVYLEFRSLSAMLLGQVPVEASDGVTERIKTWIIPDLPDDLIMELLSHGLFRIRQETPQKAIKLVEYWMVDKDDFHKQLGLRALGPMIEDPNFENLPAFFRLIQPLTRSSPPALRPDLLDVLAALAQRSAQETAYYLRQTLDMPKSPDTAWMIRQSLRNFPSEIQESLREAVRGIERRPRSA